MSTQLTAVSFLYWMTNRFNFLVTKDSFTLYYTNSYRPALLSSSTSQAQWKVPTYTLRGVDLEFYYAFCVFLATDVFLLDTVNPSDIYVFFKFDILMFYETIYHSCPQYLYWGCLSVPMGGSAECKMCGSSKL